MSENISGAAGRRIAERATSATSRATRLARAVGIRPMFDVQYVDGSNIVVDAIDDSVGASSRAVAAGKGPNSGLPTRPDMDLSARPHSTAMPSASERTAVSGVAAVEDGVAGQQRPERPQ